MIRTPIAWQEIIDLVYRVDIIYYFYVSANRRIVSNGNAFSCVYRRSADAHIVSDPYAGSRTARNDNGTAVQPDKIGEEGGLNHTVVANRKFRSAFVEDDGNAFQ